jgi:ABC-2 type transport system ATP-binding protein
MSKNKNIAISVSGVSKSFKLPHEKNTSIKSLAINPFKRRSFEKQEVLKDISFEIKKGEFFGIVGRNGSGKSTLLKMLAGIYSADEGDIEINGKLTPFIELGVGFNPELTGRENVFLNGALLGFNRKDMLELYDEIVEFAELEKFMDQKLKNYSSGMQVRLAFSIAIRAQTQILLLDEVLAVGDANFQKKCYEHFMVLKKRKRTVVLVTHDMSAVERFCNRAMVISEGSLVGIYTPRKASMIYERINSKTESTDSEGKKSDKEKEKKQEDRWGTGEVTVDGVSINGEVFSKKKVPSIEQGKDLTLSINIKPKQHLKKQVVIGVAFYDQFGVNMSGPNSIGKRIFAPGVVNYSVKNIPFNPGTYFVTLAVFNEDVLEEYDHIEKAAEFNITASGKQLHGKINLFGNWEVKK